MQLARDAEARFQEKKAALAAELRMAKRDLEQQQHDIAESLVQQEDEAKKKMPSLLRPKSKARKLVADCHAQLSGLSDLLAELDSELAK